MSIRVKNLSSILGYNIDPFNGEAKEFNLKSNGRFGLKKCF